MRYALVLLAVVLFAQSQPPPTSLGKDANGDQKNSASQKQQVQPNNSHPQPSPVTVNQYATQPQSGDKPQANAEQDKSPSNEAIIAIGTVLLFFATMFLALATAALCVVAILQWRTMTRHEEAFNGIAASMNEGLAATRTSANAAKASADALIASERAWLVMVPPPEPLLKVMFYFKNHGRTPAWPVEMQFAFVSSETDQVSVDYSHIPVKPCNEFVVAPDGITTTYSELLNGTGSLDEDTSRLKSGTLFLHFFGVFRYKDVTGAIRETKCCYVYGRSRWRTAGRDRDNDCT